jgi:hypothetical protein
VTKDEDKAAQFQADRSGGGTLPHNPVECDFFHHTTKEGGATSYFPVSAISDR